MKKLEKEKQFRRRHRLKMVLVIIFGLVLFLAGAKLFVSNRLSNLGQEIEKENRKAQVLIAENRILDEEIRQKESLVNLSEKAKELGFVEPKLIFYLVPQIPVAMK